MPEISVTEGTGAGTQQVTFNVALSNPAEKSVLVNYLTSDGTATGGSDFVSSAGTLVIAAGSSSANFSIDIIKDGLVEGPETFTVKLLPSGDSAAAAGTNLKVTVTILDDDTVPTVAEVTSDQADGAYSIGTIIPIVVRFSKPVSVTGSPRLGLNVSPTARSAVYSSGSETDTLIFQYSIAAGDAVADLNYASISALLLNGGRIQDSFGNNADLTLPLIGLPGSLGEAKNISIDTQAPSVPTLQLADPVTSIATHVAQATVSAAITDDGEAQKYWWVDLQSSDPEPAAPIATSLGWQSKPTAITLSGAGDRIIYLYVKDVAGNVSPSAATASIYHSVPDHLDILGGQAQTAVVGSALDTALQVKVVDAGGVLSPGVSLTFTPSAGSLSNTTVTTDATGKASVNFTLGTTSGTQTVTVGRTTTALPDTAASGRASVTFSETATPDVPDHLNIIAGDNQTRTIGLALTTQPSVAVVDKYGNGVGGVEIGFTLAQGDGWIDFGKIMPGLVTTDSSGLASIDFMVGYRTLASLISVNPVSAVLPDVNATGRTKVNFNVTSSSGSALYPFQTLSGDTGSANGVGIVAFDANGDNRLDLISTNTGVSSLSLFLNSASGFLPKTNLPTASGLSRYTLTSGDFNGDGKTDIACGSNYGSNGVYIQLGDGAGGFGSEKGKGLPTNGNATGSITGDFNEDGKLDVAVADPSLHKVHVYWGDGTGGLTGYTSFAVGTNPKRIVAVDWNRDSHLDLAVSNSGSNDVTVLLGDGSGDFPSSQTFAAGTTPLGIRAADLNGDSNPDLVVANSDFAAASATILYGDGLGGIQLTAIIALNGKGWDVVIADFNNDGFLDISALNQSNHGPLIHQVFGGDGTGAFTELGRSVSGVNSLSIDKVVAGDFNGDGNLDLATAGSSVGHHVTPIVYGDGTGRFSTNPTVAVGTSPSRAALADFNKDGKLDVAVTNKGDNTVSVLLGNGLGQLASLQTITVGTQPGEIKTGDFNGDGNPDLILVNTGSAQVSIVLGKGDGTFITPVTNMAVTSTPNDICLADFNKDGKLDIAVASAGGGGVLKTYSGDGAGVFTLASTVSLSGTPYQIVCTDLNKDTEVDMAVTVKANIAILLNNGSGGFTAEPNSVLTGGGVFKYSLAVGDFDSDGNLDLVGPKYYMGSIDRYMGDGTGNFAASTAFGALMDVTQVLTGDFNGDGKIDLLELIGVAGQVSINYGDGTGGFSGGQVNWVTGNSPGRPASGDLNGDGKLDLIVPNSGDNNISIFLSQ